MKAWNFSWMAAALLSASMVSTAANRELREVAAVMALRANPTRGEQIFMQCARCHGADGAGVAAGTVPRIAGQHYRVLVRQLVDFRAGRRWDFQMEGVATSHEVIPEPQDVADVAQYVSQLRRDGARGIGNGQFTEQGAKIYGTVCASCHGAQGEGDDRKAIPRIAGQHEGYLMRQIYDAVDGRRPPLSGTHRKRLAPLSFEEVQGVSDYIARMGWPSEP